MFNPMNKIGAWRPTAQLPISRATGGRSASPDHPSRKHDSPVQQSAAPADVTHAQPVLLEVHSKPLAFLPRRRDRRAFRG